MKQRLWLIVIGAVLGTALTGHAALTTLNGLFYTWPTAHVAKALTNNASGTLTWNGDIDSGVPAGLIGFWVNTTSCPTGWTAYTAANGRYIVNGTSTGTTVGTALTAGENRTAGVHGHSSSITASISDSTHGHSVSGGGHSHAGVATANTTTDQSGSGAWNETTTSVATTGISLNNANAGITASPNLTVSAPSGAVANTNAPYIRFLVCQKS